MFGEKIVKISKRWRFRPQSQNSSLLLTSIVSGTKSSKRAILN